VYCMDNDLNKYLKGTSTNQ